MPKDRTDCLCLVVLYRLVVVDDDGVDVDVVVVGDVDVCLGFVFFCY